MQRHLSVRLFASMGWRHIGRFVLDEPRQFSSRFGPGSLPAESVARMLTTIKVVGIGSATDFPIPDAHDSTQVERGHEPSSHADLAEASVNNEFTIFGGRAIQHWSN